MLAKRLIRSYIGLMDRDPKKVVKEIVQLVGKRKAERLLIGENVSPSTAGKLTRGKYESAVGDLIATAIANARAKAAALKETG
jgi:hypothetical protein